MVVGNCTGFAVNRVFFPYTMAAIMLVDGGMDPYAIDKVTSHHPSRLGLRARRAVPNPQNRGPHPLALYTLKR